MTPEDLAALIARLRFALAHAGRGMLAVAVDLPDLAAAIAELEAIQALTDPANPPVGRFD